MLAKKEKMKTVRRVVFKDEPYSSSDTKFDVILKAMEKLLTS